MVPNDREIFEGLSQGPFAKDGFDNRLRSRIVQQIKQERKPRRTRVHFWQWSVGFTVAIAVLIAGVWLWQGENRGEPLASSSAELATATATTLMLSSPAAAEPEAAGETKKYALLIGLRSDDQNGGIPVSEYRTLLVADDGKPENLALISDLPDLYVPYGQNFWRIRNVGLADNRRMLQAAQATNLKAAQSANTVQAPGSVLSEQIMYAGNEYLSVKSTVLNERNEPSEQWWIKHIEQLNQHSQPEQQAKTSNLPKLKREPSVGTDGQWRIYRSPGKWVFEFYDSQTGIRHVIDDLPPNVIQHDQLTMDWPEITRIEPAARDAFTYGNILAIVKDQAIQIYSLRKGEPVSRSVHIPIGDNESIIMVQWAQNDKIDYVDKWIQDFRTLQQKSD
jgi:hypothetical protein